MRRGLLIAAIVVTLTGIAATAYRPVIAGLWYAAMLAR